MASEVVMGEEREREMGEGLAMAGVDRCTQESEECGGDFIFSNSSEKYALLKC